MSDDLVRSGDVRIALRGELDVARADEIVAAAAGALETDGIERLVIDMSEVAFVDSTALGAFIHVHSQARAAGVQLVLAGANHRVRRLLEVTRLGPLFAAEQR